MQLVEHLGQVALDQRFQHYEENYVLNDLLGIKGELVKVENIFEPPFKFLYIDGDITCKPEKQKPYVARVPATYSETTIYGRTHAYVVGDNDDEFLDLILESLAHNNEPLSSKNCKKLREYYN